jgi:hypothetical protein
MALARLGSVGQAFQPALVHSVIARSEKTKQSQKLEIASLRSQ